MFAHVGITLKELTPLLNTYHNILEHYTFDNVLLHGDIDLISQTYALYVNTPIRDKFVGCNIFQCIFNELNCQFNYYRYKDLAYPIISMSNVISVDILQFVLQHLDELYVYLDITNITYLTSSALWYHIVRKGYKELIPVMLQYDGKTCYECLLSRDILEYLLIHDTNALTRAHQPLDGDSFSLLAKASYNYNLSPDYGLTLLELCEDDFEHYQTLLVKLLTWRDSDGNMYNFDMVADNWSPNIVELVRRYRNI